MDVGTSGGVWGLERGYCMMIGGREGRRAIGSTGSRTLAPGQATAAHRQDATGTSTAEPGYLHCGPAAPATS